MSPNNEKKEETGFTIVDKRKSTKETEKSREEVENISDKNFQREDVSKEAPESEKEIPQDFPLPELDLASFIITLSQSVYIHLGEMVDPVTNKKEINLPLAKQTIDLITMLKEKTEGNRTADEDKIIEEILYHLRMSYVAVSNINK